MSGHHRVNALRTVAGRVARDMPNHPKARAMQNMVERLASGAEALDKVRVSRNPLDTREAHMKKLGGMARKYDAEVTTTITRLGAIFREAVNDVQRRIDEKVDLKPDAFASEIRAAFRLMKSTEQAELLGRLARENRGAELAAIVKAPLTLTGLTEETRAQFEGAILSIHAREEMAEREQIEAVFSEAFAGVDIAMGINKAFTDPAEIAKIERAEAEANAAGDAFDQSLQ